MRFGTRVSTKSCWLERVVLSRGALENVVPPWYDLVARIRRVLPERIHRSLQGSVRQCRSIDTE